MSLKVIITLTVAVILGALASFGLYQAAQPAAYEPAGDIYTYGTAN